VITTLGETIFQDEKYKDLTIKRLSDWLDEHPDGTIEDFLVEYNALFNDSAKKIKLTILQLLFFDKSPEAANILTKTWAKESEREDFVFALKRHFLGDFYQPLKQKEFQFAVDADTNQPVMALGPFVEPPKDDDDIRFPGLYYNVIKEGEGLSFSNVLSPALFPIFEQLTDTELSLHLARRLLSEDSPESVAVLRKWSESDNKRLKTAATESLEGLLFRQKIRDESKQLFHELVAGTITPDDLLPKTQPWVWEDGKYIQK